MTLWLRRWRGHIVFSLGICIAALTIANIVRHGLLPLEWLAKNKDAISALSSIVTIAALIGGAIFSYYKFFRGRTLSSRAELKLEVSIHKTTKDSYLHAISLLAKNIGSSTIWNPQPIIQIVVHRPESDEMRLEINDWWEETTPDPACSPVIDPDETVSFVATQIIPDDAWAVSYRAIVRSDQGDSWYVAKTVGNKEA